MDACILVICCSKFCYFLFTLPTPTPNILIGSLSSEPNKSLDASRGSVFRMKPL